MLINPYLAETRTHSLYAVFNGQVWCDGIRKPQMSRLLDPGHPSAPFCDTDVMRSYMLTVRVWFLLDDIHVVLKAMLGVLIAIYNTHYLAYRLKEYDRRAVSDAKIPGSMYLERTLPWHSTYLSLQAHTIKIFRVISALDSQIKAHVVFLLN